MITRRTKIQLIVFVVITLLGVSFVGAKYAQLDRLVRDDSYRVAAHFADSGGIFKGAEVTYRGVTIGRVGQLKLTDDGVDVMLDIDNGQKSIPADTEALVGNRSAVGEQYVELQPQSDGGPFLKDGSDIGQSQTEIPISTTKLLDDTQKLVNSVGQQDLRTVVNEFGAAFKDGGDDLSRLIDTSNSFIQTANENFDITTQLIDDSRTVLSTQLDKASAIRSFARDLALVSDTLVASDGDLRKIINNGSATANQLRTFLEENKVDLAKLLNNLVTTGEVQVRHLDGLRMLLIVYPYIVAGAFVVNDKTSQSGGLYDAHFGLVLTMDPAVCEKGYESTDRRDPQNTADRPMNEKAGCTDPNGNVNSRGPQHVGAGRTALGDKVLGTFDRDSRTFTYADEEPASTVTYTGGAGAAFGKESWKWLLLQPLTPQQ